MRYGDWQTRVICPGCGRNEPGCETFNRVHRDGPCPDCGAPYCWIDGVRWPIKTMCAVYAASVWWKPWTWGVFLYWQELPDLPPVALGVFPDNGRVIWFGDPSQPEGE
jgi:hypothetical protein